MNRAERRALARANRKPGKATRRPPKLLQNPVEHAISAVVPITADQRTSLGVRSHGALRSITAGLGTDQDASDLVAMVEITIALVEAVTAQARRGADPEQVAVAEQALAIANGGAAAMESASHRTFSTGRWVLAGPEMTALNECIELHDDFLRIAPQALLESAVAAARARAVRRRVAATEAVRRSATRSEEGAAA